MGWVYQPFTSNALIVYVVVGGVTSTSTCVCWGALTLPALSTARQVSVWSPVVARVVIVGLPTQAALAACWAKPANPDKASLPVNVTCTGVLYQPFSSWLPSTSGAA